MSLVSLGAPWRCQDPTGLRAALPLDLPGPTASSRCPPLSPILLLRLQAPPTRSPPDSWEACSCPGPRGPQRSGGQLLPCDPLTPKPCTALPESPGVCPGAGGAQPSLLLSLPGLPRV